MSLPFLTDTIPTHHVCSQIGTLSPEAEETNARHERMRRLGLAAAKPWGHLGDIAHAINSHAQKNGYSVVEEIGGHGIGLEFHEDPSSVT